jgi:hypothetical protein
MSDFREVDLIPIRLPNCGSSAVLLHVVCVKARVLISSEEKTRSFHRRDEILWKKKRGRHEVAPYFDMAVRSGLDA